MSKQLNLNLFKLTIPDTIPPAKNMVRVIFLYKCPKFIGQDLKHYGPFFADDIRWIPELNSIGLIKKKVCKEVGNAIQR